mmetsp:Transcript_61891/g.174956  ORF Transcript_61891/g.174956 Transcript_61891/m.174956 type:complete len:210 (-) Transcript_61891:531-1160(-)
MCGGTAALKRGHSLPLRVEARDAPHAAAAAAARRLCQTRRGHRRCPKPRQRRGRRRQCRSRHRRRVRRRARRGRRRGDGVRCGEAKDQASSSTDGISADADAGAGATAAGKAEDGGRAGTAPSICRLRLRRRPQHGAGAGASGRYRIAALRVSEGCLDSVELLAKLLHLALQLLDGALLHNAEATSCRPGVRWASKLPGPRPVHQNTWR